jgi:hypothetical protein
MSRCLGIVPCRWVRVVAARAGQPPDGRGLHALRLMRSDVVVFAAEGIEPLLRRRDNESLGHLLIRLNRAIAKAMSENIYTDEINTPIK